MEYYKLLVESKLNPELRGNYLVLDKKFCCSKIKQLTQRVSVEIRHFDGICASFIYLGILCL